MSYFAAAVVRGSDGWAVTELDLSGVSDVEDVVDLLRDADPETTLALLFVESDDTFLTILRLDDGEDLRVFGSDSAFADESRLGAVLLGDIEQPALDLDDEPDADADAEPAVAPDIDPVGDADILADRGVPAKKLLELCAHEGLLPADVTGEICQVLGCADEVDGLRVA